VVEVASMAGAAVDLDTKAPPDVLKQSAVEA
jgi:hypothetical protein